MIVECNLCGMRLINDKDIVRRLARHSLFHSTARVQGRNTTQGIPKYTTIRSDND
jgi:hypothetical protein